MPTRRPTNPAQPESVAFLENAYGLGYLVPKSALRPPLVPAFSAEEMEGAL